MKLLQRTVSSMWLALLPSFFSSVAAFAPPSTDETALVAAIQARPDEDTPRLAYADWLMENGDAMGQVRGQRIKLEIELTKLATSDPEYLRKQRELEALPDTTPEPLKEAKKRFLLRFESRRGFIECAHVDVSMLVSDPKLAKLIFSELPLLRDLRLTQEGAPTDAEYLGAFERLGAVPQADRLRVTRLQLAEVGQAGPTPRRLRSLFQAFPGVRDLVIWMPMNSEHVAEIERADFAPTLNGLNLSAMGLTSEMLVPLTNSRRLNELRYLDLKNNNLRDLALFHDARAMPKLSTLVVEGQREDGVRAPLPAGVITHFIQSERFGKLESFMVDGLLPSHYALILQRAPTLLMGLGGSEVPNPVDVAQLLEKNRAAQCARVAAALAGEG